jgi:triosephosphate isomerase
VIAYEPVWAIGTGEFAKPEQAEKVFIYIRKQVEHLFGPRAANNVRILYGGSVDDHNVSSYLRLEGCDGALVGGASLNQHKFASIVESAYRIQQERSSKE